MSPYPSLPVRGFKPFGKYGGSGDLVQCDGASWQLLAGVVPAHGVAMDTSLPWPEVLRPPADIYGTSTQAHVLAMSLRAGYKNLVSDNFWPILITAKNYR